MGLESNLTESRVDSESKERLDSNFDNLDSNTESKQLTESTTPKNPSEALLNSNNSACASTMPKRNCKIAPFLQRKNHIKCVARQRIPSLARFVVCNRWGKEAGVPSATIALEAEKRGTPAKRYTLWLPKRPNGLQAKRSKKAALYLFRGWGERGGDKPLFFLRKHEILRI